MLMLWLHKKELGKRTVLTTDEIVIIMWISGILFENFTFTCNLNFNSGLNKS